MLCYGSSHFGGLKAFSFECPGLGCSTLHDIRPRSRRRLFNRRTQRLRCPDCGTELQLSILAEILPPRGLTKQGAAEYEANLLDDFTNRPQDTVPTVEQAAALRRSRAE